MLEEKTPIFLAARGWWRSNRPWGWSLRRHLAEPEVNTTTNAERALARAVAALLKQREAEAPGEEEENEEEECGEAIAAAKREAALVAVAAAGGCPDCARLLAALEEAARSLDALARKVPYPEVGEWPSVDSMRAFAASRAGVARHALADGEEKT
jgi:hypothetical protein